ncbi:MAG: glycosyltransferase family 2 protein [Parvularculaceae bacterium]
MKLTVGILAHNEERAIAATIASLSAQSIFTDAGVDAQAIVVANGCSDRTAETAREALASAQVRDATVVELAEPGKANAWNVLIHEASRRDTDFFILLDADIEFALPDTIRQLIDFLLANPETMVAADQPMKKFAGAAGPMRTLIRALQKTGSDGDHALSGQLYAARASALRAVIMPAGIVVEDGFLRAMILTRSFSAPEDFARLRRAPGAAHYYQPYETLRAIFRYERRQAAGTAINRFVYDEFAEWRARGIEIVGEIRRRNRDDKGWVEQLIAARAGAARELLIPKTYVFRRLRRRPGFSPARFLKLPMVWLAVVYDMIVARAADRELRQRSASPRASHWDAIRTG